MIYPRITMPSPTFSPAQLDHLPTELVDSIAQYLPTSSLLALLYTCRRFNLHFSITPKTLFSRFWWSSQAEQWLLFLCMLERDQRIRTLVCSKCHKTHDATLFSDKERTCCPTIRKCLGFEGKAWVCPHKRWSLAEVQELWKGDQLKVFHPSLWPVEPCQCLKDGMFLHFMFMHVKTSKSRTFEDWAKKASGLQTSRRCVHMRLRNPVRQCFQHEDCASLGCVGTDFKCRICAEPGAFVRKKVVDGINLLGCSRISRDPDSDEKRTQLKVSTIRPKVLSTSSISHPAALGDTETEMKLIGWRS